MGGPVGGRFEQLSPSLDKAWEQEKTEICSL